MQSRSPPDQGIPSRGHGLIPADVVQAKDLNVFRLKCVPSRYGLTGVITAATAFEHPHFTAPSVPRPQIGLGDECPVSGE
jgi:hypothetical protein